MVRVDDDVKIEGGGWNPSDVYEVVSVNADGIWIDDGANQRNDGKLYGWEREREYTFIVDQTLSYVS